MAKLSTNDSQRTSINELKKFLCKYMETWEIWVGKQKMLEEERSISSYTVVLNTLDPHTQRRADPYDFERATW